MRGTSLPKVMIVAFALMGVSACATPQTVSPDSTREEIQAEKLKQHKLALKTRRGEQRRIYDVAYPILRANHEFCEESHYEPGFRVWSLDTLDKKYHKAARALYDLDNAPRLSAVFKKSAAARAGLSMNDRIIAVNGRRIHASKGAIRQIYNTVFEDQASPEITLTVQNGLNINHITYKRARSCKMPVSYRHSEHTINAFADGENIIITRGMVRFADHDNELALVLAHEMAHNTMGHIDSKQQNSTLAAAGGLAIDILLAVAGVNTQGAFTEGAMRAGARAYSVDFEREADYVGLYYMARAGYDTKDAANFWRRMASENREGAIEIESSHPTSPERFLAIEKTHVEIMDKEKSGLPLKPEIEKDKGVTVKPAGSEYND